MGSSTSTMHPLDAGRTRLPTRSRCPSIPRSASTATRASRPAASCLARGGFASRVAFDYLEGKREYYAEALGAQQSYGHPIAEQGLRGRPAAPAAASTGSSKAAGIQRDQPARRVAHGLCARRRRSDSRQRRPGSDCSRSAIAAGPPSSSIELIRPADDTPPSPNIGMFCRRRCEAGHVLDHARHLERDSVTAISASGAAICSRPPAAWDDHEARCASGLGGLIGRRRAPGKVDQQVVELASRRPRGTA